MANKFKKPKSERVDVEMMRHCLMSRESFTSQWSGERICRTCKSRDQWRTGAGYEAA